jgi:hypothetical protein
MSDSMSNSVSDSAVTVLAAGKQRHCERPPGRSGDELWITSHALEELSGWALKAEGLCKDDSCVLLDAADAEKLVDGELVNASGLWESLGRPLLRNAAASTWILGEGAEDRDHQLRSLQAPDFTLPDIEGKLHSLSDFRGKKVFLSTWASW